MKAMEIVKILREFWKNRVHAREIASFDSQGAAATFHPACVFGSLGENMDPIVYCQNSWRYDDRTQGKSPVRFAKHLQFQLVIPYYPGVINDFLDSLKAIGYKSSKNCLKLVENDWKHASLGASGVGWEVLCDQLEITQFTFFSYMGQQKLKFVPVEIAYGVERLVAAFYPDNLTSLKGLRLLEEQEIPKLMDIDLFSGKDLSAIDEQINKLINHNLLLQAYRALLEKNRIINILGNRLDRLKKAEHMSQLALQMETIAVKYRESINLERKNENKREKLHNITDRGNSIHDGKR
jgi:glycyl-tRNA synthetase alpha chain